jgi:hypothetical protein
MDRRPHKLVRFYYFHDIGVKIVWHSVVVILFLVLTIFFGYIKALPEEREMVTRHPLPYVPPNLTVAQMVNIMFEFEHGTFGVGGAGGVGTPQINTGSIEEYIGLTNEEGQHYLSIEFPTHEGDRYAYVTSLDYFFENEGSIVLVHYGELIPNPIYERWFLAGEYVPTGYELVGETLTINRTFHSRPGVVPVLFLDVMVSAMYFAWMVGPLNKGIDWLFTGSTE